MEELSKSASKRLLKITVFVCTAFSSLLLYSQDTLIIAGPQYGTSSFHQWKWGRHYRKEWTTPVSVPYLSLDTVAGGLKPYEAGGGRQSKSLRLRNAQGKEYVLRSIDKSFSGALPPMYQNTFVERIVNDQVSIANPYAAVSVPVMAEAAGILYAKPIIRYLPRQAALGSYNDGFADKLYLLEQRPDGNWQEAANYGNAKNIISTEKVLEDILEDNDKRVDQKAFVRSRLFDMFLGDWGRHEDQWRWAVYEDDKRKTYKPIPRDRDQAYTKFDGWLLKTLLSVGGLGHLQSFDHDINDIAEYNFPARNLDRQMANEMGLKEWTDIAKELQNQLTDAVIEKSVKSLPPEIFSISGQEIIDKLKSHRQHLLSFATDYYRSLARTVDIAGTKKNELIQVTRQDGLTSVRMFKINKKGEAGKDAFYSRDFIQSETNEIHLYGLAGNDKFIINGNGEGAIRLRIIGGIDKDSIIDRSASKNGAKTSIYDNPGNFIDAASATRVHLSEDSTINAFRYDAFKYNKKGFSPIIFYNYPDRLFVGINYKVQTQRWRKGPFGNQHNLMARYSIIQGAPNFLYKGVVNQFAGNWALAINAHFDFIRWTNFFGLGNEVKLSTLDRDYYRLRTRDVYTGIGLNRSIGKYHDVAINAFYQGIKIISDTERFVAKTFARGDKDLLQHKNFAGAAFNYNLVKTDDPLVPTKGLEFAANVIYTQNVKEKDRSITNFEGQVNVYVPLLKSLVLAIRAGGATLTGEPEFYQYNSFGGSNSSRGFRRDRFWGKSVLYNTNELQWLFNVRSHFFNGKFGLLGLYDRGRVWMPGENSDTWHTSYGGGFFVAPFDRIMVTVTYAKSREFSLLQFRIKTPLKR
ncbi:MAG TPA: BamA/TamA family outer membrane protein [Chitinophagaceae bacterium]|nr:BamA/TamA family outer membrane protein [Chitinophagaceae bacterium]